MYDEIQTKKFIEIILKNIEHIYNKDLIDKRELAKKILTTQINFLQKDINNLYKDKEYWRKSYFELKKKENKNNENSIIKTGNIFDSGYGD